MHKPRGRNGKLFKAAMLKKQNCLCQINIWQIEQFYRGLVQTSYRNNESKYNRNNYRDLYFDLFNCLRSSESRIEQIKGN